MSDILAEMRGVLAGHAAECGDRAPQMMVDGRLYPDEIEDWAAEVERLQRIEVAARKLTTLDVPDPVAKAIALAIIATGLREALGL